VVYLASHSDQRSAIAEVTGDIAASTVADDRIPLEQLGYGGTNAGRTSYDDIHLIVSSSASAVRVAGMQEV
jgi:hypothetical protein